MSLLLTVRILRCVSQFTELSAPLAERLASPTTWSAMGAAQCLVLLKVKEKYMLVDL